MNTKPIRVMLVDDNAAFLRIATRFLRQFENLTVVGTVCSGETAAAQARDLQPQIILLDLSHVRQLKGSKLNTY